MTAKKVWVIPKTVDPILVQKFSHRFKLHPIVVRILIQRGYDNEELIQNFIYPRLSELLDPFLLLNMKEAVASLQKAIEGNKRILVLGDYDADGITATTMMIIFLRNCGCQNVDFFIPNRIQHGYGLTHASLETILPLKPELLITVDNGISSCSEVQRLHSMGIDTIITDHHLPESDKIPEGIVVNPSHPDCSYPFKGISGCGVALKLIMGLRYSLRESGWWSLDVPEPNIKHLLQFAALGTVADVVPLTHENRIIVTHGIEMMMSNPYPAIQAFSLLKNVKQISSRTLGYQLAPLLNAAGRMQNASIAVEFLLSNFPGPALELAKKLDEYNNDRRVKESEMLDIAIKKVKKMGNSRSIVITSPEFHEGVTGVVASRLVEKYNKPTLVFARNGTSFKGSARSIPELHIRDALSQCSDILDGYGGHAYAAGCSVNESKFDLFAQRFEIVCSKILPSINEAKIHLDGELDYQTINEQLVEHLQYLQPFGAKNNCPLFIIPSPGTPFIKLKDKHVKWIINPKFEIIGWNLAFIFSHKIPSNLAVTLEINEFNGIKKAQGIIREYQ